ncbi:hypothetical protein [Bradyrhizobium sp. SYSU BS000235]|uniref:hypothetical protein n=1 Tax=Bradyrhizobium sp. SYSU BS000235 TaxID=3411332 RepID=UPI003C73E719
MTVVATLAVIWIVVFGILVLPAWPAGRWLAKNGKGPISLLINIVSCAMLAWLVVLIGLFVLIVWAQDLFPHVKDDPLGFGKVFATVLLFVPSFLAFLVGYLRARETVEAQ